MSESERRRGHAYNRVLIETERILDPQFDDAVVFLSGAQIEMLRNVTQYLNRPDTYVSEQFLGYYLTPDVEDYDAILEIVADLEETLMGNPNTIWGYGDRLELHLDKANASVGINYLFMGYVPAGEVWVLHHTMQVNYDSDGGTMELHVILNSTTHLVYSIPSPSAGQNQYYDGVLILAEGDYVSFAFDDCTLNDSLRGTAMGYKMNVPV